MAGEAFFFFFFLRQQRDFLSASKHLNKIVKTRNNLRMSINISQGKLYHICSGILVRTFKDLR